MVNDPLLIKKLPQVTTTLRWLLRRGSPLPIPNRVVKPACADGTAVLWESMSSPFFNLKLFQILKPRFLRNGVLRFTEI